MKLYEEFKLFETMWDVANDGILKESLHPDCPTGPNSIELPKVLTYIEDVLGWEQCDYERDDDYVYILYDTLFGADEDDEDVVTDLKNFAKDLGISVDMESFYKPGNNNFTVKVCLQPLSADEGGYCYDDE